MTPFESNSAPFPPADSAHIFDPDQRIVRYMRLPAFFMLLQGKVFIPSLETLAKADPYESQVPRYCSQDCDLAFGGLLDNETFEWLLEKTQLWERTQIEINKEQHARSTNSILLNVWLRQLMKQRLAWCWHATTKQSMGLWNNYGHHGVAVLSSINNIRRALKISAPLQTSVGAIQYINKEDQARCSVLSSPDWLTRPYYWKLDSYEFETELRFVCECGPEHSAPGGVELQVDPDELIDGVVYSPHLFPSEVKAIAKCIDIGIRRNKKWTQTRSDLLSPEANTNLSVVSFIEAIEEFTWGTWAQDTYATQSERPAKLFRPV